MRTIPRLATVVGGLALALSAGVVPAQADPTPSGTSASAWLRGQLSGGVLQSFGFPDYGLSIDAARSFAQDGDSAGLAAVTSAVGSHLTDYSDYDYTDSGHHYTGRAAGAVAKELVLAELAGANPHAFGSPATDLVTRLEALVGANGRIADDAQVDGSPDPTGDFANIIGQSFAAEGLAAAGSGKAAAATSFLLQQQCSAGFFRLDFTADKSASDQSCNGATAPTPDTDTTAFAVVALQGQRSNPSVQTALAKAVAWLKSNQASDGSFGGSGPTSGLNSNSTGLAAWALGLSCETTAADRAAAWVRGLQVKSGQTGVLSDDVGAVAYDPAALATGQTGDVTDQWRRATAQAAAGLAWDPSAPATVSVSAPKGYQKAGAPMNLTLSGAASGEQVCLSSPAGVQSVTGLGVPITIPVTIPAGGSTATYAATTGPGSGSVTVSILGKKRLHLSLDRSVARGAAEKVKVTGLAKRESVRVFFRGHLVAKGKASGKGVYTGRFKVRGALGKATVRVLGEFGNRAGGGSITVSP